MILIIARKEFTEMFRDGRFRWAALILFALLTVSGAIGWKHYQNVQTETETAWKLDRKQWNNQGTRNPHSAAHFGMYAFKPTPPLSFIDRGLNSYLGVAVWMEAHYQNPFQYRPAEDGTAIVRFGELTAATVMQLLIPLLIVLLSFSTFAGEKEQGTLRQLLSLGISRRVLALGKAAGVSISLGVLIVPAAMLGLLVLVLYSDPGEAAWSVWRFLVLLFGYLLYFGSFLFLSLAVSAMVSASRMALLILIAFWIFNGLILPRLATDLSQRLSPSPTHTDFWDAISRDMEQGIDGHNSSDTRLELLKQRVLKEYGVTKLEDLPINFDGIALQEGEEYGNQIFDKHYSAMRKAHEKQNRLQAFAGVIAPLLSIRSFSMGIAGTDFVHHQHFSMAAENYRRMLMKMMNGYMTQNSRSGDWKSVADEKLWKQVPLFEYRPPDLIWAVSHHFLSLLILIFWFTATLFAAVLAAGRIRAQ